MPHPPPPGSSQMKRGFPGRTPRASAGVRAHPSPRAAARAAPASPTQTTSFSCLRISDSNVATLSGQFRMLILFARIVPDARGLPLPQRIGIVGFIMNLALLKQLSEAPGVPGREERVRDILQNEFKSLFDD